MSLLNSMPRYQEVTAPTSGGDATNSSQHDHRKRLSSPIREGLGLTKEQFETFQTIKSFQGRSKDSILPPDQFSISQQTETEGYKDPIMLLPDIKTQQKAENAIKDSESVYTALRPWQTRVLVLRADVESTADGPEINKRAIALRQSNHEFYKDGFRLGNILRFRKKEIISKIKLVQATSADGTRPWPGYEVYQGENEEGKTGVFPRSYVQFEEKKPSRISCKLLPVDVIVVPGMGQADMDDAINYEALSYAWGDPAPTCLITINGKDFPIARELATALLYLRNGFGGKDRHLWCDAICINQFDLQEKAHQVRIMFGIFEKAENVIAWLGLPTRTSGQLFYACSRMTKIDKKLEEAIEPVLKEAMDEHLSQSWFFRTWVRQEVFAAKNMVVKQGIYEHEFGAFASWIQRLDNAQKLRFGAKYNSMPPTFPVYRKEYQHSGTDRFDFEPLLGKRPTFTQHWLSVLGSGALFEVTDARDRVYGALSLLTHPTARGFIASPPPKDQEPKFPIDYTKSRSEVYQDVIKYLIHMTESLEVLDVFGDRAYLEESELPSWATDFSRAREKVTSADLGTVQEKYRGSLYSPASLSQNNSPFGHLELRGVKLPLRRPTLFPDFLVEATKDSVPSSTHVARSFLTRNHKKSREERPKDWGYVFPSMVKNGSKIGLESILVKRSDVSNEFTRYITGPNVAHAKYEMPSTAWRPLFSEDLRYVVPRIASLNDIVVAFYGSVLFHLLRPSVDRPGYYRYLGPVVGVVIYFPKTASEPCDPFNVTQPAVPISSDTFPNSQPHNLQEEKFILV